MGVVLEYPVGVVLSCSIVTTGSYLLMSCHRRLVRVTKFELFVAGVDSQGTAAHTYTICV